MHYVIPETTARELGAIDRIELCKPHGLTAEQLSSVAAFSSRDWGPATTWVRNEGHDRRWMIFEVADCECFGPCSQHDGRECGAPGAVDYMAAGWPDSIMLCSACTPAEPNALAQMRAR